MVRRFRAAFNAFSVPDYRLLWGSSVISLFGVWLHRVAESWVALELTGSPAWVGLIGFLSFAPTLFLSPLGGALGDRYPRRLVLLSTQGLLMANAGMLSLLALSGKLSEWHLAAAALANGLIMSIDMPVRQAFMVEVVGREKIPSAVGLNSAAFNLGRSVGPAVAGLILAHASAGVCFGINAITFGAVMIALARMGDGRLAARPPDGRAGLIDGLRYLRRMRSIQALILVLTVLSMLFYPYVNQLPVFAREVLKLGPEGFGWLMSCVGAGAVAGSLFAAMQLSVAARARLVLRLPLLYCPALALFALSHDFRLSAAMLALSAFGSTATMGCVNASVQALVEDGMRGRVMGAYASAFNGIFPYGVLIAGLLVEWFGAPATFAAYAALTLGLLWLLHRLYRSEWRAMTETDGG